MSQRDAFLLRIDPKVLDALRRWAADDLRSVNAQVEFLLRRALKEAGRLRVDSGREGPPDSAERAPAAGFNEDAPGPRPRRSDG